MLSNKEIGELENSGSLVLSIKKNSEPSLFESIFGHWIALPTAIYFHLIRKKRRDYIIITDKSAYLIIRNRIQKHLKYDKLVKIRFNSAKDVFKLEEGTQTHEFFVKKYIPSYEEYQVINQAVTDYNAQI